MASKSKAHELDRQLARQLAGHLATGTILGGGFAFWLMHMNVHCLADVIDRSEGPLIVRTLFVIGSAAYFAFGATLTGFLMLLSEDR